MPCYRFSEMILQMTVLAVLHERMWEEQLWYISGTNASVLHITLVQLHNLLFPR